MSVSRGAALLAILVMAGCSSAPAVKLSAADQANADGIEAALLAHKDQFKACYEDSGSDATGKVITVFTIGHDGRVRKTGIQLSTLKHPQIEACLLRNIRQIRFPAPKDKNVIEVTYPFTFGSN